MGQHLGLLLLIAVRVSCFSLFLSCFSFFAGSTEHTWLLLQQCALKPASWMTAVKRCHSNYIRQLIILDTFGVHSSHLKALKRHSPFRYRFSVIRLCLKILLFLIGNRNCSLVGLSKKPVWQRDGTVILFFSLKKLNQLPKKVSSTSIISWKPEPFSLGKDLRKPFPFSTYCDIVKGYTGHSGSLSTFNSLRSFLGFRRQFVLSPGFLTSGLTLGCLWTG